MRQVRTATGVRWRFGTAQVEKRVELNDGHLALIGFTDRVRQYEYVQGPSDPIAFTWNGHTVTGHSTNWVLDGVTTRRLRQGELLLQLRLHAQELAIVKSYLLYPKESVVQEWLQVVNRSGQPAILVDPAVLTMHVLQNEAPKVDFTYMAANARPTTEKLTATRVFDSYATYEYAPLQVYQNRETKHGLFIGWDYTGLWRSTVGTVDGRPVHVGFQVAHYRQTLRPGDTIETPKAFTGVFHGDLDELGYQLLDYQYRYKWDYTRAPYFPSVSLEGYWARGGHWGGDGVNPLGNYRKVFRAVDMMRTIGSDNFWRDHGWWDKQGEWNGPNWAETRRYLAQHNMTQTIYLPIQTATPGTDVAREHPEWISNNRAGGEQEGLFFDQSQPAVLDWELKMLESRQRKWGNFEWRKDWVTTIFMPDSTGAPDSTRLLAQDQGFRHLLQTFLDRNPGMAFHGCAGGGTDMGYEMLRFGVAWQFNDGGVDPAGGYYATYLFPPDKLNNIPDFFSLEVYERGESKLPERGSWFGLLWNRMTMTSETDDPALLQEIRLLIDINHYLVRNGVFGRWGFVYHPAVAGDNPERYLERISRDRRRAVIVPWSGLGTAVTVYPKGLLPHTTYDVSYQRSSVTASRSGADLMASGITLPAVADGEIIYLNLPKHPGSTADHTPPSAPTQVTQQVVTHMDYSGVALRWQPGRDDNWISYYQIYRNGVPIDKVARGTYYFDHALGADPAARYAVATVDGSGNHSQPVPASGVARVAALVVDDTSRALTYRGKGWTHESGQWGTANGTQARTRTPGDSVLYTFTGSRITWYGRMGRDKGVAAVYVDGQLDRLVNTFNSDEFPNTALYSRTFPNVARHTIAIVATGVQTDTVVLTSWPGIAANAPGGRNNDPKKEALQERGWIVIDGLQVDRAPSRVVEAKASGGVVYRGAGWQPDDESLTAPVTEGLKRSPPLRGMRSDEAGDVATYTFVGTGITWVGRRCSRCGIADVYVDGVLATSADQYDRPPIVGSRQTTDPQYHVPLFTRRWTRSGRHTLKIVVRPDANVWSKGHEVYLDALHIVP